MQDSLFPSETVRFRIEAGHRTADCGLLLAIQEHDMPGRNLRRMEVSGDHATRDGFEWLRSEVYHELEAWIGQRLEVQGNQDTF